METTVEQEMIAHDIVTVIKGMNSRAKHHLRNVNVKQMEGMTPEDFVMDVMEKVLNGTRDWSKSKVSFDEFLFGCLRSDTSNFIKKLTRSRITHVGYSEEILKPSHKTDTVTYTKSKDKFLQTQIEYHGEGGSIT